MPPQPQPPRMMQAGPGSRLTSWHFPRLHRHSPETGHQPEKSNAEAADWRASRRCRTRCPSPEPPPGLGTAGASRQAQGSRHGNQWRMRLRRCSRCRCEEGCARSWRQPFRSSGNRGEPGWEDRGGSMWVSGVSISIIVTVSHIHTTGPLMVADSARGHMRKPVRSKKICTEPIYLYSI